MPLIEHLDEVEGDNMFHEACQRPWGWKSFAIVDDDGTPLFLIQDYRKDATGNIAELMRVMREKIFPAKT